MSVLAVSMKKNFVEDISDRTVAQLDGRSMSLMSGRYMETVGKPITFALHRVTQLSRLDVYVFDFRVILHLCSQGSIAVKLNGSDPTGDLEFSRRYLDTNLVTYEASNQPFPF
jgi:hypothetical protein